MELQLPQPALNVYEQPFNEYYNELSNYARPNEQQTYNYYGPQGQQLSSNVRQHYENFYKNSQLSYSTITDLGITSDNHLVLKMLKKRQHKNGLH
jgi:hypothetical protein